jgi:hypothetical protein
MGASTSSPGTASIRARRPRPARAPPPKRSPNIELKSEGSNPAPRATAEDVLESLESAPTASGSRRLAVFAELARLRLVEPAAQGDLAELVVESALLGIADDVEGRGDVLETLLRLLVSRVQVRMELLRQLPYAA